MSESKEPIIALVSTGSPGITKRSQVYPRAIGLAIIYERAMLVSALDWMNNTTVVVGVWVCLLISISCDLGQYKAELRIYSTSITLTYPTSTDWEQLDICHADIVILCLNTPMTNYTHQKHYYPHRGRIPWLWNRGILCAVVHQISEIIEYSHEHHLAVLIGCLNYHVPLSNLWLARFKCGQSQLLLLSILCMFSDFHHCFAECKTWIQFTGASTRDHIQGPGAWHHYWFELGAGPLSQKIILLKGGFPKRWEKDCPKKILHRGIFTWIYFSQWIWGQLPTSPCIILPFFKANSTVSLASNLVILPAILYTHDH